MCASGHQFSLTQHPALHRSAWHVFKDCEVTSCSLKVQPHRTCVDNCLCLTHEKCLPKWGFGYSVIVPRFAHKTEKVGVLTCEKHNACAKTVAITISRYLILKQITNTIIYFIIYTLKAIPQCIQTCSAKSKWSMQQNWVLGRRAQMCLRLFTSLSSFPCVLPILVFHNSINTHVVFYFSCHCQALRGTSNLRKHMSHSRPITGQH